MASIKSKADTVDQIEAFAKLGGSINLRVTRDGADRLIWMAQAGTADGMHAVTASGPEFTDMVAELFGKLPTE